MGKIVSIPKTIWKEETGVVKQALPSSLCLRGWEMAK